MLLDNIVTPIFVPGDRADRFHKAAVSGADAVIIDLEDSVAPHQKEFARRNISSHQIENVPVFIRINAPSSEYFSADLAALETTKHCGIVVSKAEGPEELKVVQAKLDGSQIIVPLIETAAGMERLPELLRASGVHRAAFGAFDFSLDIGCDGSWESLLLARSTIVLCSRGAGIQSPWDSPSSSISDLDAVKNEAERASSLGFGGKMLIHPAQLHAVKSSFLPTPADIEWAQSIIGQMKCLGASAVGGAMVDKPIIDKAERILRKVNLITV